MNKYSIDYNSKVMRTQFSPQSLHWRRSPSSREPGHETNVSLVQSRRISVPVKQTIVETRKKHSPKPRHTLTTVLFQSVEIVNHVLSPCFDNHNKTVLNCIETPHTNNTEPLHTKTVHATINTEALHATINTKAAHATINTHNCAEIPITVPTSLDPHDMDFEFVELVELVEF